MPTYLVPAMLRIEAESIDEANEVAAECAEECYARLSRIGRPTYSLYLDEELPTVETPEGPEWEFPHTMLDEAVCSAIFGREV
jgi:hypothetical protein